ncbi:hypothetical protein DOK67_0002316 [Enterococcus sp. DIV0212c]|uniref:DNA-binding response regulator n=1 Tax=Enterococcus sp. DIV0212c TaxID=2230867 RepID=UPI001AC096C2|nr:response regulator transcription factor [Enterococcus sp. DIV0212c]
MYELGVIPCISGKEKSPYIVKIEKNTNIHYLEESLTSLKTLSLEVVIILGDHLTLGEICKTIINIREKKSVSIWILCEKSDKTSRMIYMKLGASGTVDKQIDPEEFSVFILGILATFSHSAKPLEIPKQSEKEPLNVEGHWALNYANLSILIENDREISLTKLEFQVIDILKSQLGVAMSHKELYNKIWNDGFECKKYRLANLICHIRKKIEKDIANPQYIKTIHSKGYMLSA